MPQKRNLFFRTTHLASPFISFLAGWSANEFGDLSVPACLTLGIGLWTALWWIFEVIPIPVASLASLGPASISRSADTLQVAQKYGHPLVLLLLGGFLPKRWKKAGLIEGLLSCWFMPAPQGRQVPPAWIHAGHRPPIHVDI